MIARAATHERRRLTWTEVVIWFRGRAGWHFKLLPLHQRAAHPREKLWRTSAPRFGVTRIPGPSATPRGKLNFVLSRPRERTTQFSRVARRADVSTVAQDCSVTSTLACRTGVPSSDIVTSYVPTGHGTLGSRVI